VAWLTVREAADALQISESAVRKRAQRGTLSHSKGLDGHLHVYVDAEKMPAQNASSLEEESRDAQSPAHEDQEQARSSWLPPIAELAALLTGLGAMTYFVGLVAVYAPIYREYAHDVSVALYAASLVPRQVVIGLGVRYVFSPPIVLILLVAVVSVLTIALFQLASRVIGNLENSIAKWLFSTLGVVLWLAVMGGSFYLLARRFVMAAGLTPSSRQASNLGELGQMALNSIAGILICTLIWLRVSVRFELTRQQVWRTLSIAYVLMTLGSLADAYTNPSALDPVKVSGTEETRGTLVGHSDGYWYLFNSNDVLVAIADDDVKRARIFE
jgi:hypothetical protein